MTGLKKKILVIDDDREMLEFLSDILLKSGYDVQTAENGKVGLEKVTAFLPDLIITDIVMPEKEGLEVLLELKKKGSPFKVIAISGGLTGSEFYLKMAAKIGADRTIKKPFKNYQEILQNVRELLEK